MAKLRIPNNYGVAPNELLNNKEISLKAKGLFTYIQSKPDGWDFSSEKIALQNKDGRDGIRNALKELEETGLLTRTRTRSGEGHWEIEYTLHTHHDGKPVPVTQTDYPTTENPTTENPSLKKERYSKKDIVRKKELAGSGNPTPAKGSVSTYNPLGAEIIKAFESIDSQNKTYYGNTTQREACDFLINEYGLEGVLKVVRELLPTTNKRPRYEFPHISTPHQLKTNWTKLVDSSFVKNNEQTADVAFTS